MGQVVIWALLTGGITGATWAAIVLFSRQRTIISRHEEMVEAYEAGQVHGAETASRMESRLAELEDRLDFAERLLTQRDTERRIEG